MTRTMIERQISLANAKLARAEDDKVVAEITSDIEILQGELAKLI